MVLSFLVVSTYRQKISMLFMERNIVVLLFIAYNRDKDGDYNDVFLYETWR